jgi:dihydrolipoamide dehydrogenase
MPSCAVIGAGPGGYDAAIRAAENGFDVTLIEKEEIGGTCLNWGCIPTKALYDFTVNLRHQNHYNNLGIINNRNTFSYSGLNDYKNILIENERRQLLSELERLKITYLHGKAEFIDEHTLLISGEQIYADYIILALGASPKLLPFDLQLPTSKEVLSLNTLPKSLTIIGAGVIGCEFANIFNILGVNVTVIDQSERLLASFDSKAPKRLLSLMKRRGINVLLGSTIENIVLEDGYKTTVKHKGNQMIIHSDQLMSAIGRIANTNGINLDKIGIKYNKDGIIINDNFQTNIAHIYAIGDLVDDIQLAHKASHDAMISVNHMLGLNTKKNTLIPKIVYSFPMIAEVGNSNYATTFYKHTYRSNSKAKSIGEEDGYIEWGIANDIVVSAVIIGYDADILIHECSIMIGEGMTVDKARNYIHAHPSFSEIIGDSLNGIIL